MSDGSTGAAVSVPHVLRDYALLADGERGIVVGPRGDFSWMCFPRWHGDPIFSSLIGGGGAYAVTPVARFVWGGYYEQPGLIWRSRWVCDDHSIVECRQALAVPAVGERAVVLRRVIAVAGHARVRAVLQVGADFGRRPPQELSRADDGTWTARVDETYLRWGGAADAKPHRERDSDSALELVLELPPEAHHDLVLVLDRDAGAALPDSEHAWQGTEAHWRARVPEFQHMVASRDARHAYSVLAGLTSAGGGMVAAATTSLPERAEQGRNYDYRYVWIRDQCYTGQSIAHAGGHPLMDDAVRFVRERLLEHGPDLKPAYTSSGDRVPDQRQLDLPGYPGGTDIVGNWVNEQFQLDAFGEALLLFSAAADHDHLDADGWRAAETAASAIEERWQQPDAGIWEIEPDAWTHSRLICAAGLRAISAHQPARERAATWLALAERIIADTAAHAVHPSGRWQRSPTDERIDAALLLPSIRGGIPATDPRSLATLAAVEQELTRDGYCYRYRPDDRPLGEAEGAFLLCGFVMSLAYQQLGDGVAAARWLERNRAACGPPGLLSEEFDVGQRQMRGNLPQAFVHALMLECAATQAET